ncbi:hypothetical protein SAMN04488558_10381 [Ignavigranum ruoffiae]|uniref:Bacteriophage holin of superfamily 6 (Holin_LLH) n=1 Tax=Ignavigranum ruoffiae TaxID=89093 RepID=A0A1H9BTR1_9LACT|nr:hypothetical protein [Ignavigranum ruoffiae]SEP91718.1 hypothetical protein SAMN04488558_10381 [Ignavigranum ruoffiae]
MELFKQMFTTHLFQTIIVGFFALGSWLANRAVNAYRQSVNNKRRQMENESEEQELLKQGVLALLRFRVNRMCMRIKEKSFMTLDEKLDLDDIYKAYELLGGNSRTHLIYEETIKRYEIKEDN